jgi:O-acetylhomoserine/O-acetylserine sulfhydrylase-like pyridoxal-dependent enzyme
MALTTVMEAGHNFVSTSWLYGGTYNQAHRHALKVATSTTELSVSSSVFI